MGSPLLPTAVGRVFQFLIGRVKILLKIIALQTAVEFQFLIGRVKITEEILRRCSCSLFQFLIGRVKMDIEGETEVIPVGVSIPYR